MFFTDEQLSIILGVLDYCAYYEDGILIGLDLKFVPQIIEEYTIWIGWLSDTIGAGAFDVDKVLRDLEKKGLA